MSTSPRRSPANRPLISIGDLVADLIVSIPTLPVQAQQHQLAQDISLEPGGGANFLIAGARLGYPMAAIGVLGEDDWGQQVATLVQAEGVDLSAVQRSGTTTQVIVLVSKTGEHVFLGKYGHGGTLNLGETETGLIKKGGAVYCTGYTLAETRLVDLTLEAMTLAQRYGLPLFFDPGPQITNLSDPVRRAALSRVDTLLLTEAELLLLTTGSISDLMAMGPNRVVLKQGPKGCTVYSRNITAPLKSPGYAVPVVDTSAAGDSFNAAFIIATLWGWPLTDCARLANAVGAAKVKKMGGGRNVPTLSELRAVIRDFNLNLNI